MKNILHKDGVKMQYPVPKARNAGYLDVGSGHELFYYETGNSNGPPVLIVHGGPGGGLDETSSYMRVHDPKYFRIIALEQRGCGRSKPHVSENVKAAIHKNNPDELALDFEKLRKHLGIKKWHVFGYSWGSCLGALYASKYPKSVLSLTIGGIWMHTPREIDWYFNYMGLFFPEYEESILKLLPKNVKRFDRLSYIYKTITGKDHKMALKMAETQGFFEYLSCFFTPPPAERMKSLSQKEKKLHQLTMISLGALECTFMVEHPLKENWFATTAAKKALKSIKDFHIIQGRYDIVCPPTVAYELQKAHPHSKLTMVQYSGHSMREPEMVQAILNANNRLKKSS